ncbi:hypothetical protein C3408_22220 [Candidatus Pantoea alvi]|nr:hypothetical protein C3408_22220 [Pantoea alvi]
MREYDKGAGGGEVEVVAVVAALDTLLGKVAKMDMEVHQPLLALVIPEVVHLVPLAVEVAVYVPAQPLA